MDVYFAVSCPHPIDAAVYTTYMCTLLLLLKNNSPFFPKPLYCRSAAALLLRQYVQMNVVTSVFALSVHSHKHSALAANSYFLHKSEIESCLCIVCMFRLVCHKS